MTFWCLQIDQKLNEICVRISALASKKRSSMKKIGRFYFDSLTLLFWFVLFLKARTEILTKILLVFLVDLKTQKCPFKINWPLERLKKTKRSRLRKLKVSLAMIHGLKMQILQSPEKMHNWLSIFPFYFFNSN